MSMPAFSQGNKAAEDITFTAKRRKTSSRTFSAAEEFTYNLKNLKRATIVGETTGGGAHPGGSCIVNDYFLVWVPSGRAINPITKTNWEGKSIEPHIYVPLSETYFILDGWADVRVEFVLLAPALLGK